MDERSLGKSGLQYLWTKLKAKLADKADAVHEHSASTITEGTFAGVVTAQNATPASTAVRNISAGTADLTAGSSELATGAIYLVYE